MLAIAYYSNPSYFGMIQRLNSCLSEWGIPFRSYNREWLEQTTFYGYHKDLLDCPRGNGFWSWKPYIILDALQDSNTVIYFDSSILPESKEAILELVGCTDKVGAIETQYWQSEWTKRSCFKSMNCDEEKYWNSHQIWAGVVVAKKSGQNIVEDWFAHCSSYSTISDEPSKNNFPGFMDHRHDQSILTNILIKHNQPFLHSEKFKDLVFYT